MSIGTVTLSGTLIATDEKPIAGEEIGIYTLLNLFQAAHVQNFTTGENGEYKIVYPFSKIGESLFFISSDRTHNKSVFKKFIVIDADKHDINIPSPPFVRKRFKPNPHQVTRKDSSSSFDKLLKSKLGNGWQSTLVRRLPAITTELNLPDLTTKDINDNFKLSSFPLGLDSIEMGFLRNTIFFSPPEQKDRERKTIYKVQPVLVGKQFTPSVQIEVENRFSKRVSKVSLSYEKDKWVSASKGDLHFAKLLYLANSAAVIEGLATRCLGWGFLLPSIYAQAFLTTISEKNPMHDLLKVYLTEDLLFERHLGILNPNPLWDLLKSSGLSSAELQRLGEQALRTPYSTEDEGRVGETSLPEKVQTFYQLILLPFVTQFFESYSETLGSNPEYWREIYNLSELFSSLQQGKPFINNPKKPAEGDLKRLKEWCMDALFYTLFMPFILRESLLYLTDLEFASLNHQLDPIPELPEIDPQLPPCGNTSIDNAWMQLTVLRDFYTKRRKHVMHMPEIKPVAVKLMPIQLKTLLDNNARDLKKAGISLSDLKV